MKRLLFMLFIVNVCIPHCYGQVCYGENLVPNSSLDSFSICPNNVWQIEYAVPWTQPLKKSVSSVFNQCAFFDDTTSIDTAYLSKFEWRSTGMAFNIIWDETNWRTYIEVNLKKQLAANTCYYSEFYVRPLEFCYKTIDAIGIYFSDTLVKIMSDTIIGPDTFNLIKPIYVQPQITNPTGKVLNDTTQWTKISGTFVAQGTETAMIVGNFIPNNEINWQILNDWPSYNTWYFYDDFLVCACADTVPPDNPSPAIYIPNVFSPNGDGFNDVFIIRGENISAINLRVYNRWGSLVFESNNLEQGWDGRFMGQDCPVGVYFYSASVTFYDRSFLQTSGNISILR